MDKKFSETTGIQGFSSPIATDHFIIFAANEHLANHVNAWLSMNVSFFRPLVGAYKGRTENSWLVRASDFDKVKCLLAKEESILYLGTANSRNNRAAKLIFLDGVSPDIDLGHLVETDKATAMASEAFTMDFNRVKDLTVSRYWICAKLDIFGNVIPAPSDCPSTIAA